MLQTTYAGELSEVIILLWYMAPKKTSVFFGKAKVIRKVQLSLSFPACWNVTFTDSVSVNIKPVFLLAET